MFGETRQQPTGLADLLLWFGLVDDGIVLQRDGSLLAAWGIVALISSRRPMRRWPR